jgi:hypothetical protein
MRQAKTSTPWPTRVGIDVLLGAHKFRAAVAIYRLIGSGAIGTHLTMVAPTGFEPVFPHRRTLLPANQRLAAC